MEQARERAITVFEKNYGEAGYLWFTDMLRVNKTLQKIVTMSNEHYDTLAESDNLTSFDAVIQRIIDYEGMEANKCREDE